MPRTGAVCGSVHRAQSLASLIVGIRDLQRDDFLECASLRTENRAEFPGECSCCGALLLFGCSAAIVE